MKQEIIRLKYQRQEVSQASRTDKMIQISQSVRILVENHNVSALEFPECPKLEKSYVKVLVNF